jgi:hypothetical protein
MIASRRQTNHESSNDAKRDARGLGSEQISAREGVPPGDERRDDDDERRREQAFAAGIPEPDLEPRAR